MLTPSFNTIGLIIRQDSADHVAELTAICRALAAHGKLMVHYLDQAHILPDYPAVEVAQIAAEADLVVSVGGDGTLLKAARLLVDHAIPLVGINLGRLGFLADVTMVDLQQHLDGIFQGHYSVEKRFLLEGRICIKDEEPISHLAVNDVILHSHKNISMIEFEVFSDGQLINKQRADGLIVATPTGSTAYALSGGGPIMYPGLEALALVPICPHTLSNRPIVLPSQQEIEIRLSRSDMQGQVSFDGITRAILRHQDKVCIKRHAKELTLLHPAGYDYFQILRAKLKWSSNP
ncbi:MAG: NAD(+) kinase [Gammaproteobacteria bacterium]|nr:NAD(+) kinase [Gammaproteobacteria bacterium]